MQLAEKQKMRLDDWLTQLALARRSEIADEVGNFDQAELVRRFNFIVEEVAELSEHIRGMVDYACSSVPPATCPMTIGSLTLFALPAFPGQSYATHSPIVIRLFITHGSDMMATAFMPNRCVPCC